MLGHMSLMILLDMLAISLLVLLMYWLRLLRRPIHWGILGITWGNIETPID
jgi:hypothetical protein